MSVGEMHKDLSPARRDMHIPAEKGESEVGDDVQDSLHSLESGVDSERSRHL